LAPDFSAVASATDGDVPETAALPFPFQYTLVVEPLFDFATMKSPPSTRKPL
jgi:hypothetical protein